MSTCKNRLCRYSTQLPCSMLVWVGGTENRSNSDFEPSWIKAISHEKMSRLSLFTLRTPDPDCGPSPRSVIFIPVGIRCLADSFNVLPPNTSSATCAVVFTAFAKIFLPWLWKNGSTKRRNCSVCYPIRDRAEICVPQIWVSLRHSVCGSTPRTDREHRRSNRPFAS